MLEWPPQVLPFICKAANGRGLLRFPIEEVCTMKSVAYRSGDPVCHICKTATDRLMATATPVLGIPEQNDTGTDETNVYAPSGIPSFLPLQ